MDRIDLHAHTDRSDGTDPPEVLVRRAAEAGLAMLAVTDHDTTEGLEAARRAGQALGVTILAGCEISTRIETGSLHVLGWDFDPGDARLEALLARIRSARAERNARMRARLAGLGMPLAEEEILRHVAGQVVARPHFARALAARGYVAEEQEAFDRWIGDDGPAYVVGDLPTPEEAIRAVREAGGVTALAHPKQLRLPGRAAYEALLARLVAEGLDGIEVHHPSHTVAHRNLFGQLARRFHLVATGGSDYHGWAKPRVALGTGDGTIDVRRDVWDALVRRRAARARERPWRAQGPARSTP